MDSNSLQIDHNKYAFEMINIHKSFNNGRIKANIGINLLVEKNSIHAIIGENGAGKSTLMSILFGLYEQDEGDIYIGGQKVKFSSSKDAAKYNIGMVHQHFKLIDNYSIIDNVILGSEDKNEFGFLTRTKAKKKLNELISKYGFNLNLNQKVSTLTVGQQQKVEILKVLYRDSNILIFDEPTAVLSDDEIKSFLNILKIFKESGKTIVLISHKLHEIKEIADKATVIRKGEYVDTIDVKNTSIELMAELMVGRKIVETKNNGLVSSDVKILEVKDLDLNYVPPFEFFFNSLEQKIHKFLFKLKNFFTNKKMNIEEEKNVHNTVSKNSFFVRSGEIFAIAGVEGNGQTEIAEYISGLKISKPGNILFLGKDISKLSINKRIDMGISHVPEDRHKHGLTLDQSCRRNAVNNLISKKPFSQLGIIVEFEISQYADQIIEKFDVRGTANGSAKARSLSGGNQQKLIVGREMTKDHKLLLMVQPIRGLDVGAIEYIHKCALEEKNKGNAVILISYELDEILSLADTIAVMSRNNIVGIGSRAEMTRQKIGELIAK
ncbi:ABC transporter ATP-binding protein [Mycoplasmoides pirum]|uniref:ABC transporter ATP-binding protein n=1 Tax=Mycoplasmoides pirum TaxID=2122 RepID=UPI000695A6D1|nr:ABC transporter ATP-binding protein [Mycoplasmoides pirum]